MRNAMNPLIAPASVAGSMSVGFCRTKLAIALANTAIARTTKTITSSRYQIAESAMKSRGRCL